MLGKRGLSVVIASILLVLLAIVAVSILSGFVVPFVSKSLKSADCFEYRNYYKFDESFGYNCYTEEGITKSYIFSIKVNPDEVNQEIQGFSLRFLGDGIGNTFNLKEGEIITDMRMLDDIGGGSILIPKAGGEYSVLTYVYTSDTLYNKTEMYPMIDDKRICEKSDEIKLVRCS